MKYAITAIILVWLMMSVALYKSCSQLGEALDKCHPGVVTTEKNGQKSITIDCTAQGKTGDGNG